MRIGSVHDLLFETDTLESLELVLRPALEITGLRYVSWPTQVVRDKEYPSEATSRALDHHRHFGTAAEVERMLRCYERVAEVHWREPHTPYAEGVLAAGVTEAVTLVMARAAAADRAAFERDTGEGAFSSYDGAVHIGYRLHGGIARGSLRVSLCHVYSPK